MAETFESAVFARVATMLDACTRCGRCVEVCPLTAPAGVAAEPRAVIDGVIDILRRGAGNEAARKWANACALSGECIKACAEAVNPRFLLAMARLVMASAKDDAATQRRGGVEAFRKMAREVTYLSRLQLDDALLQRLGQGGPPPYPPPQTGEGRVAAAADKTRPPPDFVFYTGCNVLKTPHIALLALDIMDALGISYTVMGGPTHCCGVLQMRAGDAAMYGRMAESTLDKLAQAKTGEVLSWCPSCHVLFTETALPVIEQMRGAKPFAMTPFMLFLRQRLDRLRPLLRARVPMRVALHRHAGIPGAAAAAADVLRAVPGVELVDLQQPVIGLVSNYFRALPAHHRQLQDNELAAAERAGVDALVTVYHSDHRELCAHERDRPFRIINILEIAGASMGLHYDDHFKRLKMLQDADAILADCRDLMRKHGIAVETARLAVAAMLEEQPLPLQRG